MFTLSRIVCATTFVAAACLGHSQVIEPAAAQDVPFTAAAASEPPSWQAEVLDVSLLRFFVSLIEPHPAPAFAACPIAPLESIDDAASLQLESNVDAGEVVDVAGMSPAAAGALVRFRSSVAAAGGTIVLKSAYRPSAYQQHLQDVWYKWMHELRHNRLAACQDLRAQVQAEFTRHRLLETQHPVAISDHTRGLAFDALVELPRRARLGRRRVTLDSLAHLVGFQRPAVAADPVHFKYTGAVRYAGTVRYVKTVHRVPRYAGAVRRTRHRNA